MNALERMSVSGVKYFAYDPTSPILLRSVHISGVLKVFNLLENDIDIHLYRPALL